MALQEHYESYRDSLQKTILEGCVEFAKATPTARPDLWPTGYDYLNTAVNNIRRALAIGDPDGYHLWLKNHQAAMLALFQKMVGEELVRRGGGTELNVIDMIKERGWRWFKFCPYSVMLKFRANWDPNFDPWMAWLPRYVDEGKWSCPGTAVFDADEMEAILASATPEIMAGVLKFKVEHPWHKIVEFAGAAKKPEYLEVKEINVGLVSDWSLELFPN
jgi:hypothetical protein